MDDPLVPLQTPETPNIGRTSLVLSASQIEYLERLCARFRRDSGVRFTKAVLLRVLVSVLSDSGIPFAEIRSETHLKEWLRGIGTAPPPAGGPGVAIGARR
jgi:hypothetical protein